MGVGYASSLTVGILFSCSVVTTFVGVVGVVGVVTTFVSVVGLVIISFATDSIKPGFCIFRRNTTGFNRRINALTNAFTIRLTSAVAFATSRRLGSFTIFVIVAPAATTTIFVVSTVTRVGAVVSATVTRVGTVVSTTVTRVGTVIAATVTRVGTVIAAIIPSAIVSTVISTARRASLSAIITTTQIASTAVISSAAIVTAANSRQGIEGRSQNDISIAIDYAETGSCERVYINIIFTFRAQLERAASGSTTFALGCDTSQGCSISTRHNLVDGFSLEPIDTDHGLLKNIPYRSKDDQATGAGFTLSAIRALIAFGTLTAFRPIVTFGTLTAITTATSSVFIFFFSIVCGIVCGIFVICASRLAFAVIGFSYLFFFGHGRRR